MDLEQALQLIDRVLSNVQGSRQDHMAISEAFRVIVEAARGNSTDPTSGQHVPENNGQNVKVTT